MGERHAGSIRSDDSGERIDGRAENADARTQQDDGNGSYCVIARRDHDRDQKHIEGERFLGHAVGGAAEGEQCHQEWDHPFLTALQTSHGPLDARIDRAGGGHDPDEPADHQDEQSDVDGVCRAGRGIVEPADRRHEDLNDSLGRRICDSICSRNGNLFVQGSVLDARILTGWNDPCQRRDQNDQAEQDGEGCRKPEAAFLGCVCINAHLPPPGKYRNLQ